MLIVLCHVVLFIRFFYMSYSIFYLFKLRPDDIIYDTLPLYHTNGGILSIGNCLLQGCTVVIRKKFSASRFWDDCIQHRCTVGKMHYDLVNLLYYYSFMPLPLALCFWSPSMSASVHASGHAWVQAYVRKSLLAGYLKRTQWREFHQILLDTVVEAKDELIRF